MRSVSADLAVLAGKLADTSGEIVKRYFRSPLIVDTKDDRSPVTMADREVETALSGLIDEARPGDGFFGEETEGRPSRNSYLWVIDPIDGTKAFIAGKPIFGTLIALLENDVPILGVIDQPITGERWFGMRGHATTLNGVPIKTSQRKTLASARLGTSSPEAFFPAELEAFNRLSAKGAFTSYGGDCYSYGLVALGTLDVVAEANLKLYDFAALIPIIEGAGGIVTGWKGEVPSLSTMRILAAASQSLHTEALAYLDQVA